MSDLEEYVEIKAPVAVVRRRVGECGLGFTFDKTAEDRLRSIGASADLIAMLANVGRSGLDVRSTPPGATVTIDGQRRGTTPLVLNDVPPGPHRVLLTLEGYLDNASDVTTRAGDTARIERTLTRAQTSAPAQAGPAAAPPPKGGGSKLPWILGGAAAAGAGVAIAAASGGGGNGPENGPPPCTVTISRTSFSFGFGGGSQTADVTTNQTSCTWSFSNLPSWLAASPTTGTGNATVSFTAEANTVENGSTQSRSATFTLASSSLNASQEGLTCNNTATIQQNDNITAVGGGGTLNQPENDRHVILQTAAECRWTGQSSVPWMLFRQTNTTTISGTGPRVAEGGNPTLPVAFQPNPGARRTGMLRVATTTFNVTQCGANESNAGGVCTPVP
jgi:hypothetical protein